MSLACGMSTSENTYCTTLFESPPMKISVKRLNSDFLRFSTMLVTTDSTFFSCSGAGVRGRGILELPGNSAVMTLYSLKIENLNPLWGCRFGCHSAEVLLLETCFCQRATISSILRSV